MPASGVLEFVMLHLSEARAIVLQLLLPVAVQGQERDTGGLASLLHGAKGGPQMAQNGQHGCCQEDPERGRGKAPAQTPGLVSMGLPGQHPGYSGEATWAPQALSLGSCGRHTATGRWTEASKDQ